MNVRLMKGEEVDAVQLVDLAARDLAVIARIRPDIGSLLDDTGVTQHLQQALELLREQSTTATIP